jgi:hypothetical protein
MPRAKLAVVKPEPVISTAPVPTGMRVPPSFATLEEERDYWKGRVEASIPAFRALRAEKEAGETRYAALAAAYEEERAKRIKYEADARQMGEWWQQGRAKVKDLEDQLTQAGIPFRLNYTPAFRGPDLDAVIRDLRTRFHPDKWAQVPGAAVVTHELMVYLSTLSIERQAPRTAMDDVRDMAYGSGHWRRG